MNLATDAILKVKDAELKAKEILENAHKEVLILKEEAKEKVTKSYEEAIKNYIDLKDGEQILYKEVKKKEPKVQNAKTNNAKGENEGLLIIDTTNKKNTNNKTEKTEEEK